MKQEDLSIDTLGPCTLRSPLQDLLATHCSPEAYFVQEDERAAFHVDMQQIRKQTAGGGSPLNLEVAGPRHDIFFNPTETTAAIVTCGGLCPGINNVIRGLVMTLFYRYGVKNILGIRYGYQGLVEDYGHEPVRLTPDMVNDIHRKGGSILATSRGPQDAGKMVDFLLKRKINVLFVIGGDGTQRGALAVVDEVEKRGALISVIGIPKTIDNDILYMDQTFGFASACSTAVQALSTAHTEAISQHNGIGLVKLMGRHSGFIAAMTSLGRNVANYVLIPEIPLKLEGENGLLEGLRKRIETRRHAVIVVAEGAGQNLFEPGHGERDASGNLRLKDIGLYLADRIREFFKENGIEINLKYIDPSYMIRAVEASPFDALYCARLAQNAVHAAMSGRTRMVISQRHRKYVHLPMKLIAQGRKRVNPNGDLWLSVLEATGQPAEFC